MVLLINVIWLSLPFVCHYFIRPLPNTLLRASITTVGCFILLIISCKDLSLGDMSSVFMCTLYWMTSIRLIQLMVLNDQQRNNLTIKYIILKLLWFILPITLNPNKSRPISEFFIHVGYHLTLALVKITICQWIHNWLIICLDSVGGGTVVNESYWLTLQYVIMFYISICTGVAVNDIEIVLVSLISLDKYEIVPFNNWPILSSSPREFWGRRYNKIIGRFLHETIFIPLQKQARLSVSTASMASFIVSGALHVHIDKVVFNGYMIRTPVYFILQGLACNLEAYFNMKRLPHVLCIVLTNLFMLITSPLYPALFIYAGPAFQRNNPPLFKPIFQLPVPNYCPR
ncbi:unnamed protein product [Didymodactylos carnosus]|uniref:Wax synthase domain-containing protein n=1 Tax=Didymodactylos carnosus TaxID=1234261 RepID=A0A815F459_9BILA|nr:unnamed protein product [Didymodactylos carnosus]CAF1324038.1 unnamed protein product [Didymodactylos carnosus]CAF3660200.1 unnamed protein product [Didymodactylos carnosus]CAF4172400.1 unnamed protein product [Didymodactylos carnosus]